jgi:Rhodopirellula transposase DDE domain
MAPIGCCSTSLVSTRRPFVVAVRNWQPRLRANRRIGCAVLAAGGQRPKKDPLILPALEALVTPETAGDPMSTQKWVRSSLRTLSRRLDSAGHTISPPTVGRLLRSLDYSLHVNNKQVEARSNHPDRDTQFSYIDQQRASFAAAGPPIISVDTKKRNWSATSRRQDVPGDVSRSPCCAIGRG